MPKSVFRSASSVQEVQLEKPRVGITFPRCSRWPSFRRSAEWTCESLGLHRVSRVFPRNDGQKSVARCKCISAAPVENLKTEQRREKTTFAVTCQLRSLGLPVGFRASQLSGLRKCAALFSFFSPSLALNFACFRCSGRGDYDEAITATANAGVSAREH